MLKQLKSGYISDSIAFVLNEEKANNEAVVNKIDGLLVHLSSFDVFFPEGCTLDFNALNPVLATVANIISRGLPTKAPKIIEDTFVEIGLVQPNERAYEFYYPTAASKIAFETIFDLLHIVKPKLNIAIEEYAGQPEGGEWHFLDKILDEYPFLKQILQSQRDFATIDPTLVGGRRVDFSFEYPYLTKKEEEGNTVLRREGLIFEFDGVPYHEGATKFYDKYRDDAAEDNNFTTFRQPSDKKELLPDTAKVLRDEIFAIFAKNYERNTPSYLKEYTLLFIPFAVARVQRTIIEFLLATENKALLEKKVLTLAVIERDVPCAALAIKGLEEIFYNLNALLEENSQSILPKIELSIYENTDFVIDKRLHLGIKPKDEAHFNHHHFDMIIDHSILMRSKIYKENTFQREGVALIVRSSHYFDRTWGNTRRVYCADLLNYKPLVERQADTSYKAIANLESNINYFIQNIFRKKAYREGQLPIISRALQQKTVIGLLPTGGGKSLTYQLPVLMQPGVCLVVDPIKALMEDQTRVLKNNGIDTCTFINSNLDREEKPKRLKEKSKRLIDFRYGENQFLFVSPERFVMEDFRNIIKNLDLGHFGIAISYCVIDEVHCVSEWGHDFRSTYLMLGKNAQAFSKVKNAEQKVSLIGLTATASFDVLADIERELDIKRDDVAEAIIMIENTIRPELFFRVIDVTGKKRIDALNDDFRNAGKHLTRLNNAALMEKSIEHHLKEFDPNFSKELLFKDKDGKIIDFSDKTQNDFYSIIFCPVRGEKTNDKGEFVNDQGVRFVHDKLGSESKGFFFAAEDAAAAAMIPRFFEEFTTDKLKHMVCTKAFGMGIDKSDIRSTYHFFYPTSLESFVQEAGRAGRDQKVAEANVLISTAKYFHVDIFKFFTDNCTNPLISNNLFTRRVLRNTFSRRWNPATRKFEDIKFSSLDDVLECIELTIFKIPMGDAKKLKTMLRLKNEKNEYQYIYSGYSDRRIQNFFYDKSFKGIESERSQALNLFETNEFEIVESQKVDIIGQGKLKDVFNNNVNGEFSFLITSIKEYTYNGLSNSLKVCKLLNVEPATVPPFGAASNQERIETALKYSHHFIDFLFLIEEKNVCSLADFDELTINRLRFVYGRDRDKNDTGRLIYRMHSMGFLTDYTIDYKMDSLFKCTFVKREKIEDYLAEIELYFRRYLSEKNAKAEVEKLKKRTVKESLIDNILECLYFLSEFSYKEIAAKRKRATDYIEDVLNKCVTNESYKGEKNWFEQNKYLKEEMYYYFNAKYARPNFQIGDEPYSLLDDYKKTLKKEEILNKEQILTKYLSVFKKDGTEQNNYKHMIGACKKIMRALAEKELQDEWLLRLLKAFAMYAVNNPSYIREANEEVQLGFKKLYESFEDKGFDVIKSIFEEYFRLLIENITPENPSLNIIRIIRLNLLLDLQSVGIEKLIQENAKTIK